MAGFDSEEVEEMEKSRLERDRELRKRLDRQDREQKFKDEAFKLYEDFHDSVLEVIENRWNDDGKRPGEQLTNAQMDALALSTIQSMYHDTGDAVAKLNIQYFPEDYEDLGV